MFPVCTTQRLGVSTISAKTARTPCVTALVPKRDLPVTSGYGVPSSRSVGAGLRQPNEPPRFEFGRAVSLVPVIEASKDTRTLDRPERS